MRRLLPVLFFLVFHIAGIAQENFITVWDMNQSGSADDQISFGLTTAPNTSVAYTWSATDGSNGSGIIPADSNVATISGLPNGQIVTLSIESADLKTFNVYNINDNQRLTDVLQWGSTVWNSMENAFYGASNLNISATDVPDLSNVTNMSGMFRECINLNGPANIGTWDISSVTNINSMFRSTRIFNQNIGSWNTSNITNMGNLFSDCFFFNQNIENWNTANVTDMSYMFYAALSFNQNIGNWNTDAVTNMSFMFCYAQSFNQILNNWNTANVTDMSFMFSGANSFNQNIGNWKLNSAVDMNSILFLSGINCINYSLILIGWANNPDTPDGRNLDSVNIIYGTNAEAARTYLTTTKGWTILDDYLGDTTCGLPQTISVSDITKTYGDTSFTPIITVNSGLEISYESADNTIAEAFQDATDGNKWKLKINKSGEVNITAKQPGNNIYAAASDAIFKLTINKAPLTVTANATTKEYGTMDPALTYTATGFVGNDDQTVFTGTLTRMPGEAVGTYAITLGTLDADNYDITYTATSFIITAAPGDFITVWDMSKVATVSNYEDKIDFHITSSPGESVVYFWLSSGGGSGSGTVVVDNSLRGVISGLPENEIIILNLKSEHLKAFKSSSYTSRRLIDVSQWGTAQWSTMQQAFSNCINLNITATDIPDLNQLTDMSNMFVGCESLDSPLNIGSWNTSTVTDMSYMFMSTDFNQNISNWNTANVTNMQSLFAIAKKFNQDISNWNTEKVTNMSGVFLGASIFNQNISSWNTSKVTQMDYMLAFTESFNQNIENWDTSNVTTMIGMFHRAKAFNQNIGNWNTAAVTDMSNMFGYAESFNRDISNWNTSKVTNMESMFQGTTVFNQNIGNWDTSNVTNMKNMFQGSRAFNQNIGSWITANVTTMESMFWDSYVFNQNIGNWDTSMVINMQSMFQNAKAFNQNIGSWQLNPNVNILYMLNNSALSCQNYSFTLNGWADNPNTPSGRSLGAMGKQYGTNAQAARALLTGTKGWTITGDNHSGQSCGLSQTITASNMVKTYGDGAFVPTATASSNLEISYVSSDNNIAEAFQDTTDNNKWKLQVKKTGEVNITAQQAGNETYNPATNVIFKLTIKKAALTVSADAKTKIYGSPDPALTYTVTGFENGDDQSIITGALSRAAGENIGTYAINQGTLATSNNYNIVYTGADFDITKAALNIVAEAKNKVYGSTDPALTYTVTGLTNGDDQTVITGTLSRVSGENIGTYAIEQGTLATTANYDLVYTAADFDITKAALNIIAEAKNKVYGTADPALTYTVTGLANNDDQSIITGALSRTAGENIGTYEIQKGTLATTANYDIVYTGADFDITKAALNIVAEAKNKVYGTADPVLTYTVTGLANNDDSTIITGTLLRAAGENIGTYAIQQGTLATSNNYDIVYTKADFDITKAALNIAAEVKSKVYGSADPALTYTITGLANGDDQSVITGALLRTAGENIGTYAIEQGTLATTANYDIVYTGADFDITKAALNIAAEAKSKVYGSADPALTYTVTGLANNDNQSIITGALTRTTGENIGTYAIEQGTLATTANYDIVYTGADFDITKAALNIVAEAKSKVYGTTDPALTYTVTGFENGDDQSVINGTLSRVSGENIGTYAIEQGTLATSANYDIVYTAADLTITKAALNIVAEAKNKIYGTADPVLTYTVTGLANNDDQSIITGALSRTAGENIGTYAIEQGTLATSNNYDLVYTKANFDITKATLNITAEAKSKVYGTTDPALTYTVNGLANNDDQSIITGALSRTAGENIGTYAINQGTLVTSNNYDIVYTGADFNITKATLNIVSEAKTKVYGSADPALTYTVNGLANGDDQSIITGALSRTAGENIGTYEIQQGTLATTANYDIVYTGADFDITKAALNIVAEAKTKVYGTADPVLTYTVNGFINGDTDTLLTGALTRVTGENIGTYAINQGTLTAGNNYSINYTNADFDITKAALNIVAEAKTKVYSTADPALTYTVTGFVNGDDQTVINGVLTRTAGEDEGTYAIVQGTLNADNYEIIYTGADFIIFKTFTIIVTHQTNVSCNGGTDGSATVEATGGIPQYTYSWAPYGGNQATANGLTAGTYTVTITDTNGLTITQEFIITEPPVVMPPTANTLQTICAPGDVTINDIQIQGSQIKWYATDETNDELANTTLLVNGTTYYASQTINGCESPQRTAVTVTLNTIEAPVVNPYTLCDSATVADLFIITPTGVSYKWYTSATAGTELTEETVLTTGTYYVEKIKQGCISKRTAVLVTILDLPASPTGATTQSFTVDNIGEATIADLIMDQENITWYLTYEDARTGNNPLVAQMPLVHGQTYYAVITGTNGCPSLPTAVTVDITLDNGVFDKSDLKYYPNPTIDVINIEYKNIIDQVTVYNLLGQKVMTQQAKSKEMQLNME